MRLITRHNKGFKYEHELTTVRRFEAWINNAVSYAILYTAVAAISLACLFGVATVITLA